jgi:hypothetical protein
MKISESELREIIKEVLQNENWIDTLRSFKPKSKLQKAIDALDAEDPPKGSTLTAADFARQLKTVLPGDLSKIQPEELSAIMDILRDLLAFAEEKNVFAGDVANKISMLNKSLGQQNREISQQKRSSKPESDKALPPEVQTDIVTILTRLKLANAAGDDSSFARNKKELVGVLKQNGFVMESKITHKFPFTTINLLCKNKMLKLNEELHSFVKKSMMSELIKEQSVGSSPQAAAASQGRGGMRSSTVGRARIPSKVNFMFAQKLKKHIDDLGKTNLNAIEISDIVNNIYTDLADEGFIEMERFRSSKFGQEKATNKGSSSAGSENEDEITDLGLVGDEPPLGQTKSQRERSQNYVDRLVHGDKAISENLFRFINHLSEQNIIKFNKKQKRIINTMMLAETQLRIQKQINESIRG